jgi:hypothetical protein
MVGLEIPISQDFGVTRAFFVKDFQASNKLVIDAQVGFKT